MSSDSTADSLVESIDETLRGIEGEYKNDKNRIRTELEEIQEAMGHLKTALAGVTQPRLKEQYNSKIAQFKTRISAAEKSLLFSGKSSSSSGSGPTQAQREKALNMDDQHERVMKMSKQAVGQLHETIKVGEETAAELALQREKTRRIHENLREINAGLDHANITVNKIKRGY